MVDAVQQVDLWELTGQIKLRAKEAGFDRVGIAPAEKSRYADYFKQWLDGGQAGTMKWLSGRTDERLDPATYLPGAKSVICVAMNYHVALAPLPQADQARHGRVALYALGDDYHELIKKRLHALADWIRQSVPTAITRAAVDTAPVMEKELAARSGVGWLGKNTCIINE